MHIYFSGIGGAGMGPLALLAHQAGYSVSGSDKQESQYIDYLRKKGIKNITIGQKAEEIIALHHNQPIDWIVYSSAVSIENPNHPELIFARENNLRLTKRDELLNEIITKHDKKLIAVAGTHGKTTTAAMAIWLAKELNLSMSYSVGGKLPFGDMGQFDKESEYFIYECDEFDRNFLAFHPHISLISGIDYDHHEIFSTREDYLKAFRQFLDQSTHKILWLNDFNNLNLDNADDNFVILDDNDPLVTELNLLGEVNRKDALLVVAAFSKLTDEPLEKLIAIMETFPGLSRRFERIIDNLYSDYAHTIPKIKGCLQMAGEHSQNVVVVYEPLTNRRQYHIKESYKDLFKNVKKLYWTPSYLAREDPKQKVLSPEELIAHLSNPSIAEPAQFDAKLKQAIKKHLAQGDLVVCLSGGGGGSLDEWLRQEFKI